MASSQLAWIPNDDHMPAQSCSLSSIHLRRNSFIFYRLPHSSFFLVLFIVVRREIHGITGTQPNPKSVNDVTGAPPNTNPARSDQG
ncbi:hypothetical protein V8C26DRAFT_405095 [Trichoderma gracile]